MKFLVAIAAFAATIALSTQSLADHTPEHKGKSDQQNSHDQAGNPEPGDVKQGAKNAEANKEEGEGHHGLAAKMNSLFPTKQPNPEKAARPATVETKSPAFLTTVGAGDVKLEWSPATNATAYHLQVATDPNFKWLVVNEKFVKETTYTLKAESGKRYFWRVAGFNGDNNSMYTKSNFVSSAFNVK
jgi:hypothetical protein